MSDDAICKFTAAARKVGKLPDNWHGWTFKAVTGAVLVTGAVCQEVTQGKRKGQPNYRKADLRTKCTVSVPSSML